MNFFYIATFLLVSVLNCFSQDSISITDNILTTTIFKQGTYANFNEFIKNSPSTNNVFSIENSQNGSCYITFEPACSKYELVFGVCYKDTIYINNQQFTSSSNRFSKLIKLDYPISYFMGPVAIADKKGGGAAVLFGLLGAAVSSIPSDRLVGIDMRTGDFIILDDYGINKLLKDDEELTSKHEMIKKMDNNELFLFQLIDAYNTKKKEHQSFK